MTSLYRAVITKAWEITKRFKFLWLFGLFAAALGNAADFNALFKQLDGIKNNSEAFFNLSYYVTFWGQIMLTIKQIPIINKLALILLILFGLVIAIVLIWLAVTSQAALVHAGGKFNDNKKTSLKGSFIAGAEFSWKVFVVNLIARLITCILLSLLIGPLLIVLIAEGAKFSLLVTILAIVIFVPIAIIINFITKYAVAYIVLKGQKCWEAIGHAWRLFTKNWLISVEMALIVLVINVALAFILMLISILLISPFILIGLTSSSPQMLYILMGGSLSVVAIIFLFAAAVFATWQNIAWTLLFIKLEKGNVFPKIVRWVASKIAKKEA